MSSEDAGFPTRLVTTSSEASRGTGRGSLPDYDQYFVTLIYALRRRAGRPPVDTDSWPIEHRFAPNSSPLSATDLRSIVM